VIEKYGFTPLQIPDYKGLAGDTSDNIIGIKGIGEKTATEVVKKYGTIEHVYEVLKKDRNILLNDGFKERIVKLFEEGEEEALFSKTLATIRRDAPIEYVYPDHVWKESISEEAYKAMCDEFEFRSLREKLHLIQGKPKNLNQEEETIEISDKELKELQVMTHLLHSEMTQASLSDIENMTGARGYDAIKEVLIAELTREHLIQLFHTVEEPLMKVLETMHASGITLNTALLETMSEDLHKEVKILEQKIHTLAGKEFNIASPKQLGEVLYDTLSLGTKIKKTKTKDKRK
jgi:DNA polymerase-1